METGEFERVNKAEEDISQLFNALREIGLGPQQIKRYVKAAMRLRELEKQYGKNYNTLVREYEKKFRESVKLEYSINELLEKRRKIEFDLRVYMEQHKLTLETVNKVVALLKTLEQHSVDINNLENLAKAAAKISSAGLDVKHIFEVLVRLEETEKTLKTLEEKIASEEERLRQIQSELNEKEKRLKEIVQWSPEIEDLAQVRDGLVKSISELEERQRMLSEKLEEMAKEYELLMGFKADVNTILKTIEERKAELESLDKEIKTKKETIDILEEEVASARSLLMLLQKPELVKREDLEALSRQLLNVARVKAGEIPILKNLEQPLVENVRKRVIELVLPAIKNDLIPKWVFEKLEKEFKEVVAKKAQLEEENEKLRAELGKLKGFKQTTEEKEPVQITPFFRLRRKGTSLYDDTATRVKLKCPYCQSTNLLVLPSKTELEAAIAERDLLTTSCSTCSKDISVDPTYLHEKFYRG